VGNRGALTWEDATYQQQSHITTKSNLIYCSTAGATPEREQARWENHIRHLDFWHLWAAFLWVQPVACALPNFHRAFCTHCRIIVAVGSLLGRKVSRHSRIYEIHSCALCREVLLRERFPTSPISVICTWVGNILVITQSMTISENRDTTDFQKHSFGVFQSFGFANTEL